MILCMAPALPSMLKRRFIRAFASVLANVNMILSIDWTVDGYSTVEIRCAKDLTIPGKSLP
jgi:hypothetical protein